MGVQQQRLLSCSHGSRWVDGYKVIVVITPITILVRMSVVSFMIFATVNNKNLKNVERIIGASCKTWQGQRGPQHTVCCRWSKCKFSVLSRMLLHLA